jgi:hypothetical protein
MDAGAPAGWWTRRSVDAAYGLAFLAGVAYLVVDANPVVMAFEAGLVLGYALHVWDKMALYDRVVSALAQRARRREEERAAAEAEERLTPATDEHLRAEGIHVGDRDD